MFASSGTPLAIMQPLQDDSPHYVEDKSIQNGTIRFVKDKGPLQIHLDELKVHVHSIKGKLSH